MLKFPGPVATIKYQDGFQRIVNEEGRQMRLWVTRYHLRVQG